MSAATAQEEDELDVSGWGRLLGVRGAVVAATALETGCDDFDLGLLR